MKKTFSLSHPKIKRPRLVESIKNEVRKYLRRERKKTLPENSNFWSFDCRFGHTEKEAQLITEVEIIKCIDEAEYLKLDSFYLEILAKASHKEKKKHVPEKD